MRIAKAVAVSAYRRDELVWLLSRLTKLSGVQSSPTINDNEKFRVARVDRKRPRMRRENDLISK